MGNPFGLGGTATAGIVSAQGSELRAGPYEHAPINERNSGGPLFTQDGSERDGHGYPDRLHLSPRSSQTTLPRLMPRVTAGGVHEVRLDVIRDEHHGNSGDPGKAGN